MRRSVFAAWLAVFPTLLLAGCGQGSPAPAPANAKASDAPAPAETADNPEKGAAIPANLNPQETVARYLQAVKDGNEQEVAALLTEAARRKTAEANIAVAPPGSETATYSVGDMEIVSEDKKAAHVASMWTDVDEAGQQQTLRIVWVLRQEPEGWRITGMITRLSPNTPMLVLNFEDPEETVRRTNEEIARRQASAADASQQVATERGGVEKSDQPSQQPPRQARNQSEDETAQPR